MDQANPVAKFFPSSNIYASYVFTEGSIKFIRGKFHFTRYTLIGAKSNGMKGSSVALDPVLDNYILRYRMESSDFV